MRVKPLVDVLVEKLITWIMKYLVLCQLHCSDRFVAYTQDYLYSLSLPENLLKKAVFISPPVPRLPVDENFFQELTRLKLQKLNKKRKKQIWLGFAGRLAREKGVEYLVKAVIQLARQKNFSKRDCVLVFAGPYGDQVVGEADYYQSIIELLDKHDIKYHFFGTLHKGELGAFYQVIDALLLPSINQTEAFGMVQLEAMCLGTPVITTNLPGVRVPVRRTGMGLIVTPKNPLQLGQAISQVLDQSERFSNKNLQKKACKMANINTTIKKYEQLIASL